jgi:hypothetical protein
MANKMGVQNRCTYMVGNMFDDVPKADTYIMKMILHDWSDENVLKYFQTFISDPLMKEQFSSHRKTLKLCNT